jgi:predicted CXXCH cytochrome family protein
VLAIGAAATLVVVPAMHGAPAPATVPAGASTGHGAAPTGAQSCERCHTMDASLNHPVNVRPSMTVPAQLPLEDGRVTCLTCHTQTQHTTRGKGSMLRTSISDESFCTQCHEATDTSKRKVHASGTEKAHLRPKTTGSSSKPSSVRLDDESLSCMSCHDGTSATDVGAHASLSLAASAGANEHPIGVVYPSVTSSNPERRLVDRVRLDQRIRLFDQTVGCGSCHSVYSGQDHLLVMSNRSSKLCLSCHVQ